MNLSKLGLACACALVLSAPAYAGVVATQGSSVFAADASTGFSNLAAFGNPTTYDNNGVHVSYASGGNVALPIGIIGDMLSTTNRSYGIYSPTGGVASFSRTDGGIFTEFSVDVAQTFGNAPALSLFWQAIDASATVIASGSFDGLGYNTLTSYLFTATGSDQMARVDLFSNFTAFGPTFSGAFGQDYSVYDNAKFKSPLDTGPGLPGVPEPATWAMMIVGFGMAGAMIRRKKMQPIFVR